MWTRPQINWALLADAISYYKNMGYEYKEVPWLVDLDDCRQTHKGTVDRLAGTLDCLIGSAEQGFIALDLPQGKYVSCSPCFRQEEFYDEMRNRDFMKVELYQNTNVNSKNLTKMIHDALDFFGEGEIVKTDEGYDIEIAGMEIGSYGIRTVNEQSWIYGTGLALPRYSVAKGHYAKN